MKAIAFTLDAVFALVIAAIGISVLLYFNYTPQTGFSNSYATAGQLLTLMSTTQVQNVTGAAIAKQIALQSNSGGQIWWDTMKNWSNDASNSNTSTWPTIAFLYQVSANRITNGTIVTDYGNTYFAAGNVIYAVNPYGKLSWSENTASALATDNCGIRPSAQNSLTLYCIPITIASSTTSSNAPIMLTMNTLASQSYLSGSLQNIYVYNSIGGYTTNAWIEGNILNEQQTTNLNTASNVIIWINDPTANIIGTSADMNYYIGVGSTSTNFFISGNNIGEAPQLSSTYAQYDDGARVFNFYDNFAGTTLNAAWTGFGQETSTVSNGLTIEASASGNGGLFASTPAGNTVTDGLESLSCACGSNEGNSGGYIGFGTVSSSASVQNGYLYWHQPQSYIDVASSGAVTALVGGTTLPQGYLVYTSIFASGTQIMQGNYVNSVTASDTSFAPSQVAQFGYYANPYGILKVQWARTRAYPPGGAMPATTSGAIQSVPALLGTGTTSNIISMALYHGMLIYADSLNMTALNPFNGSVLWSSNVVSVTTKTPTSHLMTYGGAIIYGTNSGNLYSLSAFNGTQYWSYATIGNVINTAIADGSLVVETASNVMLLTNFYGQSGQAQVWTSTFANPNGLATYGNVIFYGQGNNANVIQIDGTNINSISTGALVTGVSIYKGLGVFQSKTGVNVIASNGLPLWSTLAPSYVSSVVNAMPVVSQSQVYTIWKNNRNATLVAMNLTNGTTMWTSNIPYGNPNPYMSIAYGKLYVSVGNVLVAYGVCPGSSGSDSLLYDIATLYLNGYTGCADALYSSISNMTNSAIFINGTTYAPGIAVGNFVNKGSYVLAGGSGPVTGTVSIWIDPTSSGAVPNYNARIFTLGESTASTGFFIQKSTGIPYFQIEGLAPLYANTVLLPNTWTQLAASYQSNGVATNLVESVYVNGMLSNSVTYSGMSIFNNGQALGPFEISDPSVSFNGLISNIQVYNATTSGSPLASAQIYAIYQGGVGGGPIATNAISTVKQVQIPNMLSDWWPLGGDTSDYGVAHSSGYPVGNVVYTKTTFTPPGFSTAYQVSSSSTYVPILNYTTGLYKLYNIGVSVWRS